MKKITEIILMCFFVLCFMYPNHANAATTELEADKNYRADLDGDGVEETIKFKSKMTDTKNTLTIYVNGKKKYTHSDPYAWVGQVCITDLEKEDQTQEIYFEFVSDSGCFERCKFLRYEKGKLKVIASQSYDEDYFSGRVYLSVNQRGDGSVIMNADTPFYGEGGLGCYYVDFDCEIEDKKIVKSEQSIFEVSSNWASQPYTLKKKTSFMKECGGKAKAFTLKKGEQVYLTRVSGEKSNNTMYAEFKTSSGKKGWIKITDTMFYKEAYLWG